MSEDSSVNTTTGEACSQNPLTQGAALDNLETSTPSTFKGGTKRFLTPSPVLILKKSCLRSELMASEEKTGGEIAMEEGHGYVSVPLPVDADDVAAHLKDTMLPEIQNMIQQQILLQQTANIKTYRDCY